MTLELTYERCVRTRSVAAQCRACVDACPTGAITLGGLRRSVEVALEDCVGCAVCQAACPTDAFHGAFDVPAFIAARPRVVACGEAGLPCVGALSSEELLTLALSAGGLVVTARDCVAGPAGHERARLVVEKARVFARAVGAEVALTWRDETSPQAAPVNPRQSRPVSAGRRQLLGLLVPRQVPSRLTSPQRLDVTAIRDVSPTVRRQRLLAAMPQVPRPQAASLPAESVGCSSSKEIDAAACTACMLCVTSCPTGALQALRLHQEIRFEARRCVNCGLCNDVCEAKAIKSAPELNVGEFLAQTPKVLVRFKMAQCGECGAPVRAEGEGEEVRCEACKSQHAEARSLWGHE